MTPEERQLLGGLFDRIREAAQGQQRDAEAEAFINNAVKAQPYAPYLLAQTVIVQEETMKGAVQKIEELEAKVRELEARAAQPQPQAQQGGGFLGGFGRSIFGAGEPSRPAQGAQPMTRSGVPSTSGGIPVPPPPGAQPGQQAQPGYGQPGYGQPPYGQQPMGQPAPWQQQQQGGGSSFLKGALGAAAGVAGGMLLANAVSGMFRGDTAHAAGNAGSVFPKGDSASPALEKSPWGESKGDSQSASGDDWGSSSSGSSNWDNSGRASGDDWGSSSNTSSDDNWDNSGSASGDDWDNGDSGGGDEWSGGDE